jgi:putative endonuclease
MQTIGKEIEDLVSAYLQQQGLKLVAANYRGKMGEIDLIMIDKDTLVFVEVRYRQNADYGNGVATVSKGKQLRIKKTAAGYLQQHNLYDKIKCRFDIIAVSGKSQHGFHWIKDAFWEKW